MSIRRILLGSALAMAVATVTPANTAEATTIAELSTEQMTDASTYIVRGVVDDVWAEVDDEGRVWTRARIQVSTTLKGPDQPESLVVDTLGGTTFTHDTKVHGQARFSPTEEVLLFLDTIQDGARLTPVAMFRGKYTIRRAPDDRRQHAMQWQTRPNASYDARFLPHPEPLERLYVDDLIAEIEARLSEGWDGQPIPGVEAEKLRTVNALERREVRR